MGALCHTCNNDVSLVRDVRGCGRCQSNGNAAGVHCRFNDHDPVELMLEDWTNPPFTTHAKIEEQKAAQRAETEKSERASAAAEAEAKEVDEEIEMAAGILLEDPSATVVTFARQIHESHVAYAVAILETRIAKRFEEMKMHAEAIAARYPRDIDDRARLVAKGEQLIGDAAAAIAAAYPDKDANAILEELGAAVRTLTAGGGDGEMGAGNDLAV